MSDQQPSHVQCPVLVLSITEPQVMGDTIADSLRDDFLALYEASGAVHVIIDMQAVRYISSAGIRPLLALIKKVREREGRLILASLTPEVEGVFTATRLISAGRMVAATFETDVDVPAAVASLYHKADAPADPAR